MTTEEKLQMLLLAKAGAEIRAAVENYIAMGGRCERLGFAQIGSGIDMMLGAGMEKNDALEAISLLINKRVMINPKEVGAESDTAMNFARFVLDHPLKISSKKET